MHELAKELLLHVKQLRGRQMVLLVVQLMVEGLFVELMWLMVVVVWRLDGGRKGGRMVVVGVHLGGFVEVRWKAHQHGGWRRWRRGGRNAGHGEGGWQELWLQARLVEQLLVVMLLLGDQQVHGGLFVLEMGAHVQQQTVATVEGHRTGGARKHLLFHVNTFVAHQLVFAPKSLRTVDAGERLVAGVDDRVAVQLAFAHKALLAHGAHVIAHAQMYVLVVLQRRLSGKAFRAVIAGEFLGLGGWRIAEECDCIAGDMTGEGYLLDVVLEHKRRDVGRSGCNG